MTKTQDVRGEHNLKPIIFFDGVCHLCNGLVDLILRADKDQRFMFAALQGQTARELLPGLPKDTGRWSIVYLDETGVHQESDAVLEICRRLGGWWSCLSIARLLPRWLRDASYRLIARNRYGVFGHRATCRIPTGQELHRFLP